MGLGNLPARANGETITDAWFNAIRDALNGDWIPKDADGTMTDQGASIGTSSYRFLALYLINLALMNSDKKITISPSTLTAQNLTLKLPAAPPGSTQALLMDTDGTLTLGEVTFPMLGTLRESVSSSSGTFSSSSASWVDVTNLVITFFAVSSLPSGVVHLFLQSDGTAFDTHLRADTDISIRIMRGLTYDTEVYRCRIGEASFHPVENIFTFDIGVAPSGFTNYKVQMYVHSGTGYLQYAKLVAREVV